MKIKKKWSFAYFLYYMCQIGFWLFLLEAVLMFSVNSLNYLEEDGEFFIYSVPVILNIEGLELMDENLQNNISIYNTANVDVFLTGSFDEYTGAFFYYSGLQNYKIIVLLLCLFFLTKFLKNVAEERPFDSENPKYLYIIGWILFLSSAINILIGYLPYPLLEGLSLEGGYEFSRVRVFRDYMMEGIFIIVLGYVFKEGTRIYEEQKLTV
jgi:hypothetical protein